MKVVPRSNTQGRSGLRPGARHLSSGAPAPRRSPLGLQALVLQVFHLIAYQCLFDCSVRPNIIKTRVKYWLIWTTSGQNLTWYRARRSADTAQRRFEFVALAVGCAPRRGHRRDSLSNWRVRRKVALRRVRDIGVTQSCPRQPFSIRPPEDDLVASAEYGRAHDQSKSGSDFCKKINSTPRSYSYTLWENFSRVISASLLGRIVD